MTYANKVTVTGCNGFVGQALCKYLCDINYDVIGTVRDESRSTSDYKCVPVGEIDSDTDWRPALRGQNTVVHLAGRAHILRDRSKDSLTEFRRVNTLGTINLAQQAIEFGISRFIFISTIGVNGFVSKDNSFSERSNEEPHSPYAISKFEAELSLKKLVSNTPMELVIIRPPAIYGESAPGNFGLIIKAINKGIPLPFANINNKRSLIYLHNLTSFIEICIVNERAANRLFIVDDNEDLSTPDIINLMGSFADKNPKIIKTPIWFLRLIFGILGRKKTGHSLLSDLQLDSSYTREHLNWKPPFNPRNIITMMKKKLSRKL